MREKYQSASSSGGESEATLEDLVNNIVLVDEEGNEIVVSGSDVSPGSVDSGSLDVGLGSGVTAEVVAVRLEDPALEARFDAIQNMLMVQIVALAFVGGALLAQLVMRWFHAR